MKSHFKHEAMAAIFLALSIASVFANSADSNEGPSVDDTIVFINNKLLSCAISHQYRNNDGKFSYWEISREYTYGPISIENGKFVVRAQYRADITSYSYGRPPRTKTTNRLIDHKLIPSMIDVDVDSIPKEGIMHLIGQYDSINKTTTGVGAISIKCDGKCHCTEENACTTEPTFIEVCKVEDLPKLKRAFEHLIKQLGGKKSLF
jgi:hypothetical protein